MKSFIVSVCAFALIATVMIINSIYVTGVGNDLENLAESISPNDNETFSELEQLWKKHRFVISVSSPHKITDEIEERICVLRAKIDSGTEAGFYETKALLNDAIDEIKVHAGISIDNIV